MDQMKKILIIAEAGVNHNGSLKIAKKMVDVAKDCGADVIKFQTAKLDSLVSETARMAEYQKNNTGKSESQKEMLGRLLLPFDDFRELADYCREKKIEFLSTPFDVESVRFLELLVSVWKIPSGEVTNYPYLVEIAKTGKPVIMSTGMCDISEIDDAVKVLKENGTTRITLLHCNTQYPTPYEDVNLRAMSSLRERYGVEVGYSDHTPGIEVPVAAVAMGAVVIEKHFTLDRSMEGPDHIASLEPEELKRMIDAVRNIEKALGSDKKRTTKSEAENRYVARKSIVARRRIEKGEMFSEENITTKRPGNGISPMQWNSVLGMVSKKVFEEDEMIEI